MRGKTTAGASRPARRGKLSVGQASGMSPAEHRAWAAAVAVLDRVAGDMERLWGVGRLPTLVPADLAAKFGRAEEQCEEAIASGDVEAAAQKAAALARGWKALDEAARAQGHFPGRTSEVWFCEVEGRAYAVCLHTADSAALAAEYPDHTAVSLQELLRLLSATEAGRLVVAAKDAFPGASLTGIKPPPATGADMGNPRSGQAASAAKPPPDWSRGDQLPF